MSISEDVYWESYEGSPCVKDLDVKMNRTHADFITCSADKNGSGMELSFSTELIWIMHIRNSLQGCSYEKYVYTHCENIHWSGSKIRWH